MRIALTQLNANRIWTSSRTNKCESHLGFWVFATSAAVSGINEIFTGFGPEKVFLSILKAIIAVLIPRMFPYKEGLHL